ALEAPQKPSRFLPGLLVAAPPGRGDAIAVGPDRRLALAALRERLAEKLPRRRVLGILRHRGAQVPGGARGIARFQVMRAEAETQQRVVLSGGEKTFEALSGIHPGQRMRRGITVS